MDDLIPDGASEENIESGGSDEERSRPSLETEAKRKSDSSLDNERSHAKVTLKDLMEKDYMLNRHSS